MGKRLGIQTFLVVLVEGVTMNDGIALYRVLEMSLVVLMARKLGPPGRTLVSIAVRIRAVMTIQCRHSVFHRFRLGRSRFVDINPHGAHREVFGDRFAD